MNEGRELPEDTNDDVETVSLRVPKKSTSTLQKDENDNTRPPSEACPLLYQNSIRSRSTSKASKANSLQADFIIQNPTVETLSNRTASIEMNIPPFSNDSEFVAIDMDLPDFIDEPTITFENPLVDSEAIRQARNSSLSPTPTTEEPRRFREKRERYGRDPNKLYETYKEEWDRLERLSDRRLGPRRKSVLASAFSMHSSISSTSDTEDMKERK
uniref:Uncharacterized protein n=1 Tax=Panagrolaimus sp. JU765 TaxID=591449 RepID=A0AC34R0P3_9BILA